MRSIRLAAALALSASSAIAEWPQFRGPNGSGVAHVSALPASLDNISWQRDVPAGKSSPIVVGERVLLTAHESDNLNVLCFDRKNGELLWRRDIERARTEGLNALNDAASPTPSSDGEAVYAFFPELGLIALDLDGHELWRTPLGPFLSEHGLSVSPVIADDAIVLQIDQIAGSHVLAIDKKNGRVSWKRDRLDAAGAYSTPLVYRPRTGAAQVVTAGPFELAAYDAASGEKLWSADELGYQPKSLPVLLGNTVYVSVPGVGTDVPSFASVDANGDGHVTGDEFPFLDNPGTVTLGDRNGDRLITEDEWDYMMALSRPGRGGLVAFHLGERSVTWREKRAIPNVASPLIYEDVLYVVRNGGILTSFDPTTGQVSKRGRIQGAIDAYYASPVAGDGKIFTVSETCLVSVIRADAEWEVLSVSQLDDSCYATPALSERTIYLRTATTLYAFGTQAE